MLRPAARSSIGAAALNVLGPALVLAVGAASGAGGCGFKNAGTGSIGVAGTSGTAGRDGGAIAGTAGTGGTGPGAGGRGGTFPPPPPPPPLPDGGNNDGLGSSSPEANCGARSKGATKVPPDILIVLDRSGSMNEDINNMMCTGGAGGRGGIPMMGCGANSKWAKTVPALTQVVSETDRDVNWGLKFFPDNNGDLCDVSETAVVPIGPGNSGAIMTAIMAATNAQGGVVGFSGTPTRSAMNGASAYLKTVGTPSPKFILLATDGSPTCGEAGDGGMFGGGGDDSVGATMSVATANSAGFKTFVVGIATGTGMANTTLSNMANAGGLPRTGTPTYYPVTSAMDLSAAIRTLIGVTATCTFQVGPPPTSDGTTSLDFIDVFGDGVALPHDRSNGYEYVDGTNKASIEVHGPLCDQIKSGAIREVTVTFRCLIT